MPPNYSGFPYQTVVFITDVIGGVSYQASGVLIAPDEVLTASHVVYQAGIGVASSIQVTPAYAAGAAPFGSSGVLQIHYNEVADQNQQISLAQSQNDFAVLHLSEPFPTLGTMGLLSGFNGGLASVAGYPGEAGGRLQVTSEMLRQHPAYSLLDGQSLGPGSSGGPVFVDGQSGPMVVGIVSSAIGSTGFFTQITGTVLDQIEAWEAADHQAGAPSSSSAGGGSAPQASGGAEPASIPQAPLSVLDASTNAPLAAAYTRYSGPVSDLAAQYVNLSGDNLNVAVRTPGWFIHTGSGTDAVSVASGVNVVDGGAGSNFLASGSGSDTFFVDDRNAMADIWSTIANFHAGDAATLWGVTPDAFQLTWADGEGAPGYQGLTLHAASAGGQTASLTLSGYSMADLSNGRLGVSFGIDSASGSAYMFVRAN